MRLFTFGKTSCPEKFWKYRIRSSFDEKDNFIHWREIWRLSQDWSILVTLLLISLISQWFRAYCMVVKINDIKREQTNPSWELVLFKMSHCSFCGKSYKFGDPIFDLWYQMAIFVVWLSYKCSKVRILKMRLTHMLHNKTRFFGSVQGSKFKHFV